MKKKFLPAAVMLLTVCALGITGCRTRNADTAAEATQAVPPLLTLAPAPSGGGQTADTFPFTDSVGRVVNLPKQIDRIAPSGSLSQIVLYSLCPDRIIGWSATPTADMAAYMESKYLSLPTFGQFYGKNVSLNLEALIAAKPDVIIDIGEAKATEKEDMDGIQTQTGIPVIFIEATLDTLPAAYTTLGELTGMADEAKALSDYCALTVAEAKNLSAGIVNKTKVFYAEGDQGLRTDASGSIHTDVIDLVGGQNVADIQNASGSGMGEVSMEQLLQWDPDVIIVAPGTVYGTIPSDPLWQDLRAVKAGRVYEIPNGPYNWMGRPPSVNRLIGVKWLGNLLYPDRYQLDMVQETQEFYRLFYHYELSTEQAGTLLANSTFNAK